MSSASFAVECARRRRNRAAPQAVSAAQLQAAIDKLGDLDYATRTQCVAHGPPDAGALEPVPALLQAVAEHARRLRAISSARAADGLQRSARERRDARVARAVPNDRLRTVAYSFFEHNPDRADDAGFLAALDKEQAEFVRPALVRALAAQRRRPRMPACAQALVREVGRGEDFFRSAVIEALGDYKARTPSRRSSALQRLR